MPRIPFTRHPVTRAYRRRLGAFEVTALSDGFVDLSFNVWQDIERPAFDQALSGRFLTPGGFRNGITSWVINTGETVILVDAGAAGLFGPNAYHFPDNLADAGLRPEDIDEVLVTHAHPDHVGGLLRNGMATLPHAWLQIDETELNFWTNETARAKAPDFMRGWWEVTQGIARAYAGRIATFRPGASLGHGITALSFPGHTPGQTGFLIESEGERLLIWGDLAVHHAIQFAHPAAHMIFDIDPGLGHQSRLRGFDLAATDRLLTAATHLPFPTFGYVARRGDAYEWVPEVWQHDLSGMVWNPVI